MGQDGIGQRAAQLWQSNPPQSVIGLVQEGIDFRILGSDALADADGQKQNSFSDARPGVSQLGFTTFSPSFFLAPSFYISRLLVQYLASQMVLLS